MEGHVTAMDAYSHLILLESPLYELTCELRPLLVLRVVCHYKHMAVNASPCTHTLPHRRTAELKDM